MRLPHFILANLEPILSNWVDFARSMPVGQNMSLVALRDEAEQILRAAARDMLTAQSEHERSEKSEGRGARSDHSDALDDASMLHAADRAGAGFNLAQLVSEYRALRASVLRLWRESGPSPDITDIDDITRFNESVDQSLAKAVTGFARSLDQSREMFLAILGHDLRTPLTAISMAAHILPRSHPEQTEMIELIIASSRHMGGMITDLMDFTRAHFDGKIPLSPIRTDLQTLAHDVVGELRTAHAGRDITLRAAGDLTGKWDPARLRQVLTNLLANAVKHGDPHGPVDLAIEGADADVRITVHNTGEPIPPDLLPTMFNPMVRGPDSRRRGDGLGLGLYIARQIVEAHGGTVAVRSAAETGTQFTLTLPRQPTGA